MRTKRTILTMAAAIAMVSMTFGAAADLTEEPLPVGETQDYIVGFHEQPGLKEGDLFHGARVVEVYKSPMVRIETASIDLFEAQALLDERVKFVEWNDPYYATTMLVPNDPRYGDAGHYGTKTTNTEAAWDVTTGSTAVKVGMLDSGLVKSHEDISRYTQGYDFVNNDNDPNDESGCSYHGTHTTGTAGATINNGKGIAGMSQHTIIPVKAFYATWLGCSGSTDAIVNGLEYIGDQGGHVSSNSWGSSASSSSINAALDYAHSKGTIHVAAAGNSGSCTDCVSYPWKDRPGKTIVVSAVDENDAFASFSSQGPEVDVAAPGVGILSTHGTSYAELSGTSMAAPHVSGAAALYLAANPGSSFSTVETAIKGSADDIGLNSDRQGAGRLNTGTLVGSGGGGTNNPPTASFTFSCTDLSCSFDGTGSSDPDGDALSYSWDFGDGNTATGATASHTYGAAGDYTVTLTVSDGSASDTDSQVVSVTSGGGGGGTVFSEDFDAGTASGWTKTSGSLWHLNTGCGTAHSGSYKLVWADSSTCTYDVGDTGPQWAKTPGIDLRGYSSASLSFWHWFETESYSGAYDVLRIQYSCDNSAWTTLQQWDSRNDNILSWTEQTYDVSGCTGGDLWVRWHADTIDGSFNNHDGWRVDTVSVTAS